MTRSFKQVDVFTKEPFKGNPVAVFFDADNLTTEEMQQIAHWTNLSETTFVQTPSEGSNADYKLRIFTPTCELPFAGHPTIGSAHAIVEAGVATPKNGVLIQECLAGLVQITHDESTGKFEFKLPYYILSKDIVDSNDFINALGIPEDRVEYFVRIEDGPTWTTIKLKDAHDVLNVNPDYSALKELAMKRQISEFSIFGKYNNDEYPHEASKTVYEARNIFLVDSFVEDPVCGSGAGADSSLLAELEGFEGTLVIKQGRKLGRDGTITVRVEKVKNGSNDYSIFVSGHAVSIINGSY